MKRYGIVLIVLLVILGCNNIFADQSNSSEEKEDAFNEVGEVYTEEMLDEVIDTDEAAESLDNEIAEDYETKEVYDENIPNFVTSAGKAKVLDLRRVEPTNMDYFEYKQIVTIEVTKGDFKGDVFETENIISGSNIFDLPVEVGDRVVVEIDVYDTGEVDIHIGDYVRENFIYFLLALFVLAILYVGKFQGLKTIMTLALTVLIVFKVHLPLVLKGINPILVTIIAATIITVITIFFISGTAKKSFAAIAGTVLGVVISGALVFVIGNKVRLTGLSSEEAAMLMYIPQGVKFDFRELLFAGILLGALGAVMDVSMSIASSMEELHKANPTMPWQRLYLSGMSVGRDIMGTMSNTLILAYTGSSLPLLLLLMAHRAPLTKMINLDIIATEIIRSLAGSIGIVMTIPITAAIAVLLLKD